MLTDISFVLPPVKILLFTPGDSLVFDYALRGWVVKESFAPDGAYFVVNRGARNELVVRSNDIVVMPFDDLDAVFPDPDIRSTVPDAANKFERNRHIETLPYDQVGKIIPTPFRTRSTRGTVELNERTEIYFEKGLENEADYLVSTINRIFGVRLPKKEGKGQGAHSISLGLASLQVNGVSREAYLLTIADGLGVRIAGSDPAGVFYGIQSMFALFPTGIYTGQSRVVIDCVEILDAPRFAYRGFLLDVARNFQQKSDVLKLIDVLAMYKVNKLNIRITEDEGWRIEIAGLPELTQVGSRRGHTNDSKNWLQPAFGSGPWPDSENNYGTGYYTREDFKEIIRYAARRHIQVIPEVCFPSHARAAIMAMEARYDHYIQLGSPEKANEFRLIDPDDESEYYSPQRFKDNIVNVALPSAYHFYETVVKDFVAMYREAGLEMTVFNTGGDEVPNGAWVRSPLCIELVNSLPGISDPRQLQGYFLEKVLEMLEKYDLQITGWEEIIISRDAGYNPGINPNFVGKNVMPLVWNNTGQNIDLGYRIANAGYPVVLCNVTNLYFDLAYNTDPKEPGLVWGGFTDAIDPYVMTPFNVYNSANFDRYGRLTETVPDYPDSERLDPGKHKNIVGLQAQLWSETVLGPEMMEYYTLPKLFAFAEKAWAKAPEWENEPDVSRRVKAIRTGWSEFSNRIGQRELIRLDHLYGGYHYRIPSPGAVIEDGVLTANISFPGLRIRYTTDGSEPGRNSPEYVSPVKADGPVRVRAFNSVGRGGRSFLVN
jgi:hexosaminidase